MKKQFIITILSLFMISLVFAQTNYNPVGSNAVTPTPNYNPVTTAFQNYTILPPSAQTNVTSNNYIVINITNNITNNVTTFVTNNLTNNITNTLHNNITNYVNLTNNITNIVENNVTTYVNYTNNISNNFYSGWLTVTYNLTNNISNNITQYVNTTNVVMVENNFTNNITNNNYVTINTTNDIVVNITTATNDTIINNVTINLNVYNITNNLSNYFNFPISLSPYILTFTNSSNISFNESVLNTTIGNLCLLRTDTTNNITVNNMNVTGNLYGRRPYGMFSDVTTQPATLANTEYIMNFSDIDDNYLVNINANKQNFTVNVSGDYKITIDTMGISGSTSRHLYIWIQKNGVNVPRTTSIYEFKNINAETLISQSYIIDLTPTDTLRVMYGADNTGVQLLYTINSAWYPSSPSARITINKIGD